MKPFIFIESKGTVRKTGTQQSVYFCNWFKRGNRTRTRNGILNYNVRRKRVEDVIH